MYAIERNARGALWRNLMVALCLTISGCGASSLGSEQREMIIRNATDLLACDASKIALHELASAVVVIGCGRMMGYQCLAEHCCPYVEPSGLDGFFAKEQRRQGAPHGSLSKKAIRAAIGEHLQLVRACYERSLPARAPWPAGTVVTKFVIEADGTVVRSALDRTSLGNPEVERCVVNALRKMKFPAPEGGGIVVVTYPFILTTSPVQRICKGRPVVAPAPSSLVFDPELAPGHP